jgi:hypothetical protein
MIARMFLLTLFASPLVSAPSSAQCQIQKLVAFDAEYEDNFGASVDIDGDWAVVGSPLDDDMGFQAGAAYLYHRANGVWTFAQKLVAADGMDSASFGMDVNLDGERLLITAPLDTPVGQFAAGSAYVFDLVNGTWVQQAKLWANDAHANQNIGRGADLSGNICVLGERQDATVGFFAGAAYVFELVGGVWSQTVKLIPTPESRGGFGYDVSADGVRLAIAAPRADTALGFRRGVVAIYERSTAATWNQVQVVMGADSGLDDYFGISTRLQNANLLVGAHAHDGFHPNGGAAYVFQLGSSGWSQVDKLGSNDDSAGDQVGAWLALDGSTILCSVSGDDDNGSSSGSAVAFQLEGAAWQQIGKLLPNEGAEGDLFGVTVALSGQTAIVGALYYDGACPSTILCNSGAAYIFELAPNARQYGSCASTAPCNNEDAHGGCNNSTGKGAVLQACGSSSVSTDDLRLEARQLPPLASALLFMGPTATSIAFGDGLRVVSPGGIGCFRLGTRVVAGDGSAHWGPGIAALSQTFAPQGRIQAGSTWNFQVLYRNVLGLCGSGFNESNGVQAAFLP